MPLQIAFQLLRSAITCLEIGWKGNLTLTEEPILIWITPYIYRDRESCISFTSIESTTSDSTSKLWKLMKNVTSKELWDIKIYLNFLVLTRCFRNAFVCIYEQTSQMYQKIANTSEMPKP